MAEIVQFRSRAERAAEFDELAGAGDIDLMTAVDVAIRDLRDITARWGEEAARLQAEECCRMLERAFAAAV